MASKTLEAKKSIVRGLLSRSDDAVQRALVVLFERQSSDEKATRETRHLNKRGFSGGDARIGTEFAKLVLAGRKLTPKQVGWARRLVLSYSRQLVDAADQSTPGWEAKPQVAPKAIAQFVAFPKEHADGKWIVKSHDHTYTVDLNRKAPNARCNCPAALYSKTHSEACKHEAFVRASVAAEEAKQGKLPMETAQAALEAPKSQEQIDQEHFEDKAAFAAFEQQQEHAAFMSDPDTQLALKEMGF